MVVKRIIQLWLIVALAVFPLPSLGHGDGSHGDEVKKHVHVPNTTNRFFQRGNRFEIVMAFNPAANPNTTLLVSHAETNLPIHEANLKISINKGEDIKGVETQEKGIYQAHITPLDSLKLHLTIQEGQISEEFIFDSISITDATLSPPWRVLKIVILLLGIIALGLLGYYLYKRKANLLMVFLVGNLIFANACFGHGEGEEEHDHDHETSQIMASENGITVPKEIQFHMGITTEKVQEKPLKGSLRLMGKVISDPAGYARLQVSQTSRIINHATYPLPYPGQKVKIDDVILAVAPTLTKVETGDQRSALYKAESEITQFRKEVERQEKLGKYAIQKNLDNARAELEKALKQKEEILNQTFKPEVLRSPINGFIADLHVRPGEIVTPDKTIVEIIDPNKYLIEAQVFNPAVAQEIHRGYARIPFAPEKLIPLKILGVSPKVTLEDQSIHILFQPENPSDTIKLDMAIEVLGELNQTQPALVIPKKSLIEDASGSWVFIHTNPETFEPRKVKVRRFINDDVEIEEGLERDEKIVTSGAYILNEAR